MSEICVSLSSPLLLSKFPCSHLIIETDNGDVDVMPNHSNFVARIDVGVVTLFSINGLATRFNISEGLVNIANNQCSIIARNIIVA